MKTRDGAGVAPLGMGTWSLGDSRVTYKEEITCLQEGLDAGLTMIDTAEIYGNGRSETLVGDVMAVRRQDAFLVSKIMPNHATLEGTHRHCRASLERLRTDYLDLYLLHWRGHIPLNETIEAMEKLKSDGLIRHWGVSNFDVEDMEEVVALTPHCACNQVLYNLRNRGTEFELLSKLEAHHIKAVACSPLGHDATLLQHPICQAIAQEYQTKAGPATSAQIALAWVLRQGNLVAIPRTSSPEHMRENVLASDIHLSSASLAALDAVFAPLEQKRLLEMI